MRGKSQQLFQDRHRCQLRQGDVVADGISAHTGILTNFIIAAELPRNFRRSQIRPCALSLDGLHLHLVGFGAFGWKNILALEVAVHHDDGGSVPVNVTDNNRHGGQSCQLAGVFASVACDQLITAVLPWPCHRGDEDAVFLDAFGGSCMDNPPAPERDDPETDAAQRAESERLLPAAVSAFGMARAFCPVLFALLFQALCSSCRHLILGTKKGAVAQGKNPSAAASLRLNASRSAKTLAIAPLISKKQITQTGPSE